MGPRKALLIPLAFAFVVGACSAGATTAPTAAPATPAPASQAAATAAPATAAPTATPNACAKENLQTLTAGKLTIGTDNPAYPPYFQPPASGKPTKPWQLGDPTNQQGFESAVAYAVASKLGFANTDVTWTVVPFDNSFVPGPKKFDIYLAQVSYTPERAKNIDFSDGYYFLNQSVVALKDNPVAKAKTIGDLKAYKFGAQVGTTAYDTIKNVIQPTTKVSVYSSNDAAIKALQAKQIDGLIVDLPTAFYVTAAQVPDSVIVGQFPSQGGADAEHFSIVLGKGSPLTTCVNQALGAMKSDGTLDQITKEWLSDKANAPVLQP